jgi:hypothetical protein
MGVMGDEDDEGEILTICGGPMGGGKSTGTTVGEVLPGEVVVMKVHSVKPPLRVSKLAPGGRLVMMAVICVSKLGGKPWGGVMAMAPQSFGLFVPGSSSDFK